MFKRLLIPVLFSVACSQETPIQVESNTSSDTALVDSLQQVISTKDSIINHLEIQSQKEEPNKKSNQEIEKLCNSIAGYLLEIDKKEKQNGLLDLFLPEYSVNWINVEENNAQVIRTTHLDFKSELKKIARKERKTTLLINNQELLSYDIQGSLYNAVYKLNLTEKLDDKIVSKRAVTFSVVGRIKGSFKIANLNIYVFKKDK